MPADSLNVAYLHAEASDFVDECCSSSDDVSFGEGDKGSPHDEVTRAFHLAVQRCDAAAIRDIFHKNIVGFNVNIANPQDDHKSAIHVCADKGYLELMHLILDNGADVDLRDEQQRTPLHWAAISGRLNCARLLVERGAQIVTFDQRMRSPLFWCQRDCSLLLFQELAREGHLRNWSRLHVAACAGDISEMDRCFKRGNSVNAVSDDGTTPLHFAATSSSPAGVLYLLQRGATVDCRDVLLETPLHKAARYGRVEQMRLLLQVGANCDAVNNRNHVPLLGATINMQLCAVEMLLAHGASVNFRDDDGGTALNWAAATGSVEILRLIIDNGGDLMLIDHHGKTPVHDAAITGHGNCLQELVECGCPINALDCSGRTALFDAAEYGRVACLDYLMSAGAFVDIYDCYGRTPLMYAAMFGQIECVALLIAKSDLDAADYEGVTALHHAATHGYGECVTLLLAAGANPRVQDQTGKFAIHDASIMGHTCVISALLSHDVTLVDVVEDEHMTALAYACCSGHPSAVRLLLEHSSANVNARDSKGKTALMHAAQSRAQQCVSLLLKFGANVHIQDADGASALQWAAANGNLSCVAALLGAGAAVMSDDHIAKQPLHDACQSGYTHIVDYLLTNGADIMSPDNEGATALHYAAANGHPETVILLLKRGAVVDAVDNTGKTALSDACQNGRPFCVQLLIQYGADVNIQDACGCTALHCAVIAGQVECVQMLFFYTPGGINALARDDFGRTPLTAAVEAGHRDVVHQLLEMCPRYCVEIPTHDGVLPYQIAIHEGDDILAEVLLCAAQSPLPVVAECSRAGAFACLPDEILCLILSFLPPLQRFSCARVSRWFSRICRDVSVWTTLPLWQGRSHETLTDWHVQVIAHRVRRVREISIRGQGALSPYALYSVVTAFAGLKTLRMERVGNLLQSSRVAEVFARSLLRLHTLVVRHVELGEAMLRAIGYLVHAGDLVELDLTGCGMTDLAMATILNDCDEVSETLLGGGDGDDENVFGEELLRLPPLPMLREERSDPTNVAAVRLRHLQLKHLRIGTSSDSSLTVTGLHVLSTKCPYLQELDISGHVDIDTDSLLEVLPRLSDLVSLCTVNCPRIDEAKLLLQHGVLRQRTRGSVSSSPPVSPVRAKHVSVLDPPPHAPVRSAVASNDDDAANHAAIV
eukprot:TRINITY_DN2718_c0_g1_i1.p1 TRINITY_DN2718_c0_g1~~TRINITY_DN2718_c0_g1_i1.p1  ORF type:complete len:1166 (+),score=223.16 TRINITY_DN2718_c0_g1_i1:136-3633(+)